MGKAVDILDEAANDLRSCLYDLDQHGITGHPLYRTRDRLAQGWQLVPPEDEAAVERAVRDAAFDVLCEAEGLRYVAGTSVTSVAWQIAARFAAARGPRAQDK